MQAADTVTPPGDRNLPINQVYSPDAFYHTGKGGRVLDVTKPPFNLETGMERDEDGVVLGSTRLPGSQRLHRKGDATREAGSLVGPMTAADSPSAISVFRFKCTCPIRTSEGITVFISPSANPDHTAIQTLSHPPSPSSNPNPQLKKHPIPP